MSIAELIDEINRYRSALGLPPLTREQVPELTARTAGNEAFKFLESQLEGIKEQYLRSLPWWERSLTEIGIKGLPQQVTQPPAQPSFVPPTTQLGPSQDIKPEFDDPFVEARRTAEAMGLPLQEYLRRTAGFPLEGEQRDELGWAQFEWQQQQAQRDWQMQMEATKQDIARRNAFAMQQSLRSPFDVDMLDTPISAFETERQKLLGGGGSDPRNWVTDFIKSVPAPGDVETPLEEPFLMAQEEVERLKIAADRIRVRMKDPDDPLTRDSVSNPSNSEEQMAFTILQAEKTANQNLASIEIERALGKEAARTGFGEEDLSETAQAAFWAAPRKTSFGFEIGKPTERVDTQFMPGIPSWLQEASGLEGRVPEARNLSNILTPSGQSWMRMTPTQQSQFAGLADWAGKRSFPDIMAQMQKQLPQAPGISKRWAPAKQRTFV